MGKTVRARLALEDGTCFEGRAFGHITESAGEAVFFSGTVGYQEVLTDPAFAGKIVVWTNPLAGNYGFNLEDFESPEVRARGFVMREGCAHPNNWRCEMDMDGFFRQYKIVGLEGVDTRALTRHLRMNGSMRALIDVDGLSPVETACKLNEANNVNLISGVTAAETHIIEGTGSGGRAAVLDLGITRSLLGELKKRFSELTVFPAFTPPYEIMQGDFDSLVISNGPGRPEDAPPEIQSILRILLNETDIRVFGVSLGCLLIASVLGCGVEKMKYGHRGCAVPVRDTTTGRLCITNQTHGHVINKLGDGVTATFVNVNDGTAEGISGFGGRASGVMFSPVTNGTPAGTGFILDNFSKWRP